MHLLPSCRTKSRLIGAALCFCLLSLTGNFIASAQLARDRLLEYQEPSGEIAKVETMEDWPKRRAAILEAAQGVMGPLPTEKKDLALEIQVAEEVDCGSYVRRLLTYVSEPGSRVPAYLLIPKRALSGEVRASGVLCLHPTDAKIGHGVAVGLGGKANRQYAAELAERGFVTIAPAYPLLANYQPDLAALGYVSGTMKAIHDNRRALDLLDSLPFVKPGTYAAVGHSLGGHNAVYTAMFEPRIKVIVSSCGLDSYREYKGGDIRGWTSTRYMPRLLQWKDRLPELPIDFPEIIASLAPRHVLISAPLHDDNFSSASVDRIIAAARPVFALHNAAENLAVLHPDCGHDFPDESRRAAYELIDRALRH